MIDREEIDVRGAQLGIHASDVQRDYIFGWLLAGLYGESDIGDRLVLKGGNGLRKGYFEATRFSDDLDFASPGRVGPEELLIAFNDACRFVQARTGVQFDLHRNCQVLGNRVNQNVTVHKYKLFFTDFHGEKRNVTLSLRVDVTEFGRLLLPVQRQSLIHPYSDQADCAVSIRVVSLEEALADKLKCLLQRTSSHDLFDLTYALFVNRHIEVDTVQLVRAFLGKTIFGPSPAAAKNLLDAVPFEPMRRYWENRIVCARESLMDFDEAVGKFRGGLDALFSQFRGGYAMQGAYFPAHLRTPILQAGLARRLLRVTYDGVERLVEPYALQFKRAKGRWPQEYLWVYDCTGGRHSGPSIKSWVNDKITAIEITDQTFTPRGDIDLAKAGEMGHPLDFASGRSPRASRITPRSARTYRLRCISCGRVFDRTTRNAALRPHNDSQGRPCRGRRGRWT